MKASDKLKLKLNKKVNLGKWSFEIASIRKFTIDQFNSFFPPELQSNFKTYSNFYWQIKIADEIHAELIINSFNELYQFVYDHLDINNLGQITVESYVMQDKSNNTTKKVYGINTFYSILKGRKNYKASLTTFDFDNLLRWRYKNRFISELYESFFNKKITANNIHGAKRSVWFTQSINNMYSLYPIINNSNISIDLQGHLKNRMVYDDEKHIFYSPAKETSFRIESSKIAQLDTNTLDFKILNEQIEDYKYFENYSLIRIYLLKNVDTNHYSFLIKPIGMDIFRFTYSDDIDFKNFFGYVEYNNKQTKVFKINDLVISNHKNNNVGFMLKKEHFMNDCVSNRNKKNISDDSNMNLNIFYMIEPGLISDYSRTINGCAKKRGAKFMLLT